MSKEYKCVLMAMTPHGYEMPITAFGSTDHYAILNAYKEFLMELKSAMMNGNHDRSDIMTDLFDVGWYIDINIGRWNKAYQPA